MFQIVILTFKYTFYFIYVLSDLYILLVLDKNSCIFKSTYLALYIYTLYL